MSDKQAAKAIESIIGRLESWQIRNGSRDERRSVNAAKNELMALVRRLEERNGK